VFKRRRVIRKRRTGRPISSKTAPAAYGFVSKRLTRNKIKAYKRALWTCSTGMQKYRLTGFSSTAIAAPASLSTYRSQAFQMFNTATTGSRITLASNYLNDAGTVNPSSVNNNVIFRGGTSILTLSHEGTECLEFLVHVVKVIDPDAVIDATQVDVAKTVLPVFGDAFNGIKFVKTWTGFLENGAATKFQWKLGIQKIDWDRFDQGIGYHWIVKIGNTHDAVAMNANMMIMENGYVCADVIENTT